MPNDTQEVVMTKGGQRAIFPRTNLMRLKSLGWIEVEPRKPFQEESELKKAGRGAALGAFAGAGMPETMHPVRDFAKEFFIPPTSNLKDFAKWYASKIPMVQLLNIGKSIGTTGLDVLKDTSVGWKGQKIDTEKTAHDVTSLLTQIALLKGGKKAVETPLSEGTIAKGAKTGSRELLGVGEKTVERAKTAAEEAAGEKMKAYEGKRAKYEEKVAEAKAEHEAKMAKKVAEHEAAVAEAKAKHQANLEAGEQSLSGSVTREAHARLKNARLEKAQKQLTASRNEAAEGLRKNLDQAEAGEGASLEKRYEDFRQKILGVSETAPNGTLQSELTPVGEAVTYAKKNVIKGTQTSLPIFNSIMGRLKDMIETPEGDLKPIEGQMIPTDQLRGYQKEISSAIYEKSLPGDVKHALGHVLDKIQSEVSKSIQDVHGPTAVGIYEKLRNDWANYKRIWFDESTVNPLPKMRAMLRDPTVMQEGVPVTERLAKMVKGEKGQSIVRLMSEKMKFGADPMLAAKLMALDRQLGRMEGLYEKVAVAKYPRVPKYNEPKAPETEPFKARGEEPEKPETEKFSPEKFRRESVTKQAENMSKLQFWDVVAMTGAIEELIRGRMGNAAAAASYPILKRLLARGIQSEPFLDWISKGGTP